MKFVPINCIFMDYAVNARITKKNLILYDNNSYCNKIINY
jgi:hypothetical protein